MLIRDIKVKTRHRHDLGDLDALAASIAEVGLLQPVVISPDGTLIAGLRRLEACKRLGWDDVPVHVADTADDVLVALKAERDENICRKDFTPSEAVAIADTIEPLEREAAKRRMIAAHSVENFSRLDDKPVRALDLTAAAVGMSRPTLNKARAVVEAARADPERHGDLLAQMDRTGRVDRAYKEMERRKVREQNAALVEKTGPLPIMERYATIVLDPPWDWGDEGDQDQLGRARPVYVTMPLEEIAALPVPDLAADNAHLYLWITNRSLPKGFVLLDRWGFRYITCLTWVKPSFGMGNYFRGSTEHVLFAVRGSLPLLCSDVGTHFVADRPGQHSAKPDKFYEIVETCSPGPWLEIFSRKERPGWVVWGAEVNG